MCRTLEGSGLRGGTNNVVPGFPEASGQAVGGRQRGTRRRGFLLHKLNLWRRSLMRRRVVFGRSYRGAAVVVAVNVDDGDVVLLCFGKQGHGSGNRGHSEMNSSARFCFVFFYSEIRKMSVAFVQAK